MAPQVLALGAATAAHGGVGPPGAAWKGPGATLVVLRAFLGSSLG